MAESSYYYKPKLKTQMKRIERELDLKERIEQIHEEYPYYGYRRVAAHLRHDGWHVNRKRVQRVMQKYGICSRLKKKSVRFRSYSNAKSVIFPNLIKKLKLSGLNELWATDITFIRIATGYIHLAAIIDVYSRKIVGWALSQQLNHRICLAALRAALKQRKPKAGCIHHSDQGVQYTSLVYVELLEKEGFRISMSAKATPTDNAYIESFFKTLKHEEILLKKYKRLDDVQSNVPRFIEEVYNRKRLHSAIGYLSPEKFEEKINRMKEADRPVLKVA